MKKIRIDQLLKKTGFIIYQIRGTSMSPLLIEGKDKVHLIKTNEFNLFDVVLFKSEKGKYILHRIVDIKDNKYYIIGDNSFGIDVKSKNELLAKMVGIYKGEEYIDLANPKYLDYMSNLFPYRDEKVRKELLLDSKAFFKNRLKEAYNQLLYLAVNSKIDISKLNRLTSSEKYSLFEYCTTKKAVPYLGLASEKYNLELPSELETRVKVSYEAQKGRYLRSEASLKTLSNKLSEAKIEHTFLKGSETRKLYPLPFLRMSNDIDVLVNPSDFDKAKELIKNDLGGKFFAVTQHDESYIVDSLKMDVELHHHINTDLPEDVKYLLESPLSNGTKDKDNPYYIHLRNEDMMLIALSHAGKHMNGGSFWITMLLDIYFLNKLGFDKEILKKARLEDFYVTLMHLCDHIFENKELSKDEIDFENYLFKSDYETYISLEKGKYSNKFSYLFHRIWLPKRYFVPQNPILNKAPILLPFFEIKRWFNLVFKKGKLKGAINEVDNYNKQNELEINALTKAGLKEYIVKIEKHNSRF